jgi:hypothetical protein
MKGRRWRKVAKKRTGKAVREIESTLHWPLGGLSPLQTSVRMIGASVSEVNA